MEPLKYDGLGLQEKLDLGRMAEHPGFAVQKKLFDDACQQAVRAVIKLNPEEKDFENILKTRQLVARITNDVCATLLKSIVMHSESGKVEVAVKELETSLESEPERVLLGERFGSVSFKPKNKQDNQ